MNTKDLKTIEGSGGGGDAPDPPVESPNTLQSRSVLRVIDLICEGEIEGFYDETMEKSIYLDRTPIKDEYGNLNFKGLTLEFKKGLPDQDYISGFSAIENIETVNVEITKLSGAIVKTITNTSVDDCLVTIKIPRLSSTDAEGNINPTEVEVRIKVTGSVSSGYPKNMVFEGKCIAPYKRAYLIQDLSQFGNAPYQVEVERVTEDSDSDKLQNKTFWDSYTEIINEKMTYPHSALLGATVDAEQFGSSTPARSFDIKGLKIQVPSNYTVSSRTYSGDWDGTFKTEWCDNPAWVYYDILNKSRYGLGLDAVKIDKWSLYTVAQYCDTYVDDGYGSVEPRFVCNLVINARKEAIHVLSSLSSIFRGMPLWASNKASVVQDRPKDITKIVTTANVIDGKFEYTGSSLKDRSTVVKVTWNDINDFCRKQVEYVEDVEGIKRYGWNTKDITAFGTTSRGQAYRVGKWVLETNQNETETVSFQASLDHADIYPGEIIEISDPNYIGSSSRYSGRVVAVTSTTLTLDAPFNIESAPDYTLSVTLPDGTIVQDIEITNAPGSTSVLQLGSSFATLPQLHSVWLINSSVLVSRQFRVISNIESAPNLFNIVALQYDINKFARVEDGIYLDEIATTTVPGGAIAPPTDLAAEEFQYIEGGTPLYGVILSWTHADDPRRLSYEVQRRDTTTGIYEVLGNTNLSSYDIKPVTGGDFDFRVRTVAHGGYSVWVVLTEFGVSADSTLCSGVENPQVVGGGLIFSGPDAEIEWDPSECHVFKEYKVEVKKTDDTLLRTVYVQDSNYSYTYAFNAEDNANPIREIKFTISVQNVYDNAGASVSIVVENPAPSMSGLTPTLTQRYSGITIDWDNITPTDNDMWKYKVYGDASTPPTEFIYQCDAETTFFHWFGLDVGTMYYIQIEPYDYFGAGVKSDIVGDEPVVIPDINVDVELLTSIEMSDSDGNSATTLEKLYDRNKISDGVSYTVSGTGDTHIQYKYAVEDLFDRIIIYTADANAKAYVAYSKNGTDWSYLKAEADHTIDSGGELLLASNQADAVTNYWQLATGINAAPYPAMVAGRYMRLYMTGSYSTTIYELVFYREIVAEMAAIDNLAALSANCGTLTAGIIQSSTYGADKGILVDLDNDRVILGGSSNPVLDINADTGVGTFKGVFTFESATSGYAQINDKPTDLGGINSTEGTKLTGIDEGADVTGDNTAADADAYTGSNISTSYTSAKCTDANADQTSANSQGVSWLNEAVGSVIPTANTSAKCTDANADQTSTKTALNTSNVGTCPATTVAGWRYGSTTYINGGDIRTKTVTAYQIAAATITASEIGTNEIIATAANIKNAVITGAKIADLAVDTLQIAGWAVTIPVSAYTPGVKAVVGPNKTEIVQSVAITTNGAPLFITCSATVDTVTSGPVKFQLYRGGTLRYDNGVTVIDNGLAAFNITDSPSSGTYTYYFKVYLGSGGTCNIYNRAMMILGVKK